MDEKVHTETDIELRSEEVQDILSRPPHTLVRWGTTAFFAIILLLLIGGCLFQYPDVVKGNVVVTTEHPPVWLVARTTSKLKDVLLSDRHPVRRGEIIAVAENPATTDDVFQLKESLATLVLQDSIICATSFPTHWTLGGIQSSYNAFVKSVTEYCNFLEIDIYARKEEAAQKELIAYRVYIHHLNCQIDLYKENEKVATSLYNREVALYNKGVNSEADYENARQTFLTNRQNTEELLTTLSSARIEEAKIQQNIIELQLARSKDINELRTALKATYNELVAAISNWELTYLFVAPADGVLSYHNVWQENQEITIGDKVFSIVTDNPGSIIAKIKLPESGYGKVANGQRVNISITGYPQMEYGYLVGEVSSLSLLSNEGVYVATISLGQDLVTSYKRKLTFTGELTGTAEIMTDERSLLERLFDPVRSLWDRRFLKY
ncbi:HlyD family efflux transporter periplasmic adaptor subunit [Bacteroides sp. 214]|uniref:HlyD family secretion protein n=1 Tax=Bacteroides sp. 214 TaxID=2302935 RepID=UPI0013D0F0B4|nr:HlyD family efflux transporter periplasmic adaptor subunit [Bacteroides sp. 214]NDW13786.1 HlyD family efflux transporter periplasmic adaptor subunit [Bacteroides sp. 214]